MWDRRVEVRRGRHLGWWVEGRWLEGRWTKGRVFMVTWWPTEALARRVAALVRPHGDRDGRNPVPGRG